MTDLEPLDWEAGGLLLTSGDDYGLAVVYDKGFDDGGTLDGDDHEAAGDGVEMSRLRLTSRALTLGLKVATGVDPVPFATVLNDLRSIIQPLPDRTGPNGLRLMRWRRAGEDTKRLWYRPARGDFMEVPGDMDRLLYNNADVVLHMEAPMPVIQSDALHTQVYLAGETHSLTNAGSFCAADTGLWEVSAPGLAGTLTITHADHSGESISFPSLGDLTVTRTTGSANPAITGLNTFGICNGPGGTQFPRWPLLRPGDNNITCSHACTITWRDTF